MAIQPQFRLSHHNDTTAVAYIERHCGARYANAFECLGAPAYRADLFRFCALYAEGGLYMDSDMVPVVPFSELYRPCAPVSAGHDWGEGVQMKILAGIAKHEVFRCMLDSIVQNVASRSMPLSSLLISGPGLLYKCTRGRTQNVAFTYLDTRHAVWPYTGMRTRERLLAFERPNEQRHWFDKDSKNYATLFSKKSVYTTTCKIPQTLPTPVVKPPDRLKKYASSGSAAVRFPGLYPTRERT